MPAEVCGGVSIQLRASPSSGSTSAPSASVALGRKPGLPLLLWVSLRHCVHSDDDDDDESCGLIPGKGPVPPAPPTPWGGGGRAPSPPSPRPRIRFVRLAFSTCNALGRGCREGLLFMEDF